MALNKAQLNKDLKSLFSDLSSSEDKERSIERFSSGLADLIDGYIKTATVSTSVTGACATPSGAGTITGSGTGTIS